MIAEVNNKLNLDVLHNSQENYVVNIHSNEQMPKASFTMQLNAKEAVASDKKLKLTTLVLKLKKKETHKMLLLQVVSLPVSYGFSFLMHSAARFLNLYSMNMFHGLH